MDQQSIISSSLYETRKRWAAQLCWEKSMNSLTSIGEYLMMHNLIYKLETLKGKVGTDFLKHGISELFEQIMSMSRKRQYQLLTDRGLAEKIDFEEVDILGVPDMKVVFQGTEGAYSQLAMEEFFGPNLNSWHVDTWREAMEAIKNGEADYQFVEIMACPGGCIMGGGQPIKSSKVRAEVDVRKLRADALYTIDEKSTIRKSHENPTIKKLYEEFLEKPGSHNAHKYLHTTYSKKEKYDI